MDRKNNEAEDHLEETKTVEVKHSIVIENNTNFADASAQSLLLNKAEEALINEENKLRP